MPEQEALTMSEPAAAPRHTTRAKQDVVFVAWTAVGGRSEEICAAVGGRAFVVHPRALRTRRLVLLRYGWNALATIGVLLRERPSLVIVTNPPVVAALTVWIWCGLFRRRFVLDSHPSAFGAKDHKVSQRLLFLHRFLARRAQATMVTTDHFVDQLAQWGAHGFQVHEAPPLWTVPDVPPPRSGDGARVLFPGVYASDEPLDVLFDAARTLPEVTFHVTGDPLKAAPGAFDDLPGNVVLTGFLPREAFAAEVAAADVILALTTEPTSVPRCGYEAVYSRRRLVISDTAVTRDVFPYAVHTPNTAEGLASALRSVLHGEALEDASLDAALSAQRDRWVQQEAQLRAIVSATE